MSRFAVACAMAFALLGAGSAQAQAPFVTSSYPLPTSPVGDEGPLGAVFNPAAWGLVNRFAADVWWADRTATSSSPGNWGIAAGKKLGFSAWRTDFPTPLGDAYVVDYQAGFGAGSPASLFGATFGWSGGNTKAAQRDNYVALGTIQRPSRFLSLGLSGRSELRRATGQGLLLSAGARPLGSPKLVVFGDYALQGGEVWNEGALVGGIAIRPTPGVDASLKLREGGELQVSVGLSALHFGARAMSDYQDGDRRRTDYLLRVTPPLAGADIDSKVHAGARLVDVPLTGETVYQRAKYGDANAIVLRDLTERIQKATDDPTVAGVALNLSSFAANMEMVWEVREKLAALKRSGKFVVAYADNLTLTSLYLASVADRLVMDPSGMILMPGMQLSRTYLRDMLDKIGIGFDEWRFLKYKSAMETYSRESMSAADREQRLALITGWYDEMAQAMVASGRVTRAGLDSVVNHKPVLLASDALALRFVDRLGHWSDLKAVAEQLPGEKKLARMSSSTLANVRWRPEEEWGKPPVISLVYTLGECAMDTGIKGRTTSVALRKIGKEKRVKAVVLRVDSPGGDPLPCDLIANEMNAIRTRNKPVFVSQGRVAASGGYWLSMNADSIFVSPFTVTGSIGVIGGWFWNDGLGKKLGLTSDRVQIGKSADLLGGMTLPLLSLTIPERNLDDQEREVAKSTILGEYDAFTKHVAGGRKLDVAYVRQIAEGHVYTGREGIEKKIVDRMGTLDETIAAAKRAAGLSPKRRVAVVEYPKPPFIRWPRLLPVWPSLAASGGGGRDPRADWGAVSRAMGQRSYESLYLDVMLAKPGAPLALTPDGVLPDEPLPF